MLTLAAAGIATAVAVTGMWRVFGDALGFTGPARLALAGFLEIALMVSAIRARRSLLETGTVGVDGAAVWGMALLSSVLAATDEAGLARAVRFAAPLVAAWLWERGLAADRRLARAAAGPGTTSPAQSIAWRWTPARLAIRLGLADPVHRTTNDVDQARRLAGLTRTRLRLAVLETTPLPPLLAWLSLRPLRQAHAAWRLQRHALAAVEHLRLGSDPAITVTIATTVAAVTGLRQATHPNALTRVGADPWTALALVPGRDRRDGDSASVSDAPRPGSVTAASGAGAPDGGDVPGRGVRETGADLAASALPHPTVTDARQPSVDEQTRPDDLTIVEAIVASGHVPSVRALQREHGLGRPRASRIAEAAAERLAPPIQLPSERLSLNSFPPRTLTDRPLAATDRPSVPADPYPPVLPSPPPTVNGHATPGPAPGEEKSIWNPFPQQENQTEDPPEHHEEISIRNGKTSPELIHSKGDTTNVQEEHQVNGTDATRLP